MTPYLEKTLRNAIGPPSDSATLPPECYHDFAFMELESIKVLRTSWVGVGRSDQFTASGDYEALSVGGVPVIVLKDKFGKLRAFANTCRHRGTQLVAGRGNTPRLVCPFHGWTYGLDGDLRGATRMTNTSDFCVDDFSLVEYNADEHAGFVFVCLNNEPPPLKDWLGNFDKHHLPWPIETLATARRRDLTVNCNWKLFLEVFNESYHLDYVHSKTFGGIYQEPDIPDATAPAVYSQFSPTDGTGGLKQDEQDYALPPMPGLSGRNRSGTRYTWLFPSITFAAGTEALWAYNAQPMTPNKCHVTMWVCFPPETMALEGFHTKAERYFARMDEALDEDIAVLERQQLGMASPHARQGRWSDMELGAATFAGWYAKTILR